MSLLDSTFDREFRGRIRRPTVDTGVSDEEICLPIYPTDANGLCKDASVSYSIRTTAETRIFR
jgi:hypothetical protein